ncbi:MAG: UvrD-helicase domain-containing protein [Faecalibacterium sp.]
MSEPKWTPAQRTAIADRGGALLVSAAAGSGKTAVLTERAVQLITDPEHPVDADRLLIVTFTNAAAAELRARIGQALLRRSQQEPGNAALRRQRMLLQRAPICTIDAFCLDLLHKHFPALEIPPDFSPADPGTVAQLRAAALAETLEKAYEDPDFCAFADLYGKGRTDRMAGESILQVYDFLRALPDYGRRLDQMLDPWQEEDGFIHTCWHEMLLAETERLARAGQSLFSAALTDCQEDWRQEQSIAEESKKTAAAKAKAVAAVNDRYAVYLEKLSGAAEQLRAIEQLAAARQWSLLYDRLTPYVLGMQELPGLTGRGPQLKGEHKESIRTRAKEGTALLERILELICCSLEEAEADRQAALPRLRALFAAVRDFDRRFSEKKQERRQLEFSDFEHLALRLLRGADGRPTPLCESIRQGYAAVMVDEYQDTNALQDALYRCLAQPAGDNLFLVGDLKQSIYRFRQADPSIFRAKLDRWQELREDAARPRPEEGACGFDARLSLDANFRSAPQVVEGINFLFERLMTPELGDTVYGEGQRLVCGAPGAYQGGMEVCFQPDSTAETDADWIAQRIAEMVRMGFPVRDGADTRAMGYGDCCILLAARNGFSAYTGALTARGIPVYADARENLFEAPHIRPLVALLQVLDNPAQDVSLAAAMLGPLFGFTDDDLVRLREQQNGISLYGAVAAVAAQDGADTPFRAKVRAFYDRLAALRRLARSVPAEQLIEEIFASTGYLAVLGAMENGARRREDARRFASFCASSGSGGISALVRAVEAARQAGSAGQDTVPGGSRPGCVTIMTIHRSKGLQFPVVFLANTGRRFNVSDVRQPVLLHREYGVGLRLRPEEGEGVYKTAAYVALSEAHARELRSEQMRLLYVALTRAQDHLVLSVPLGVGKASNPLARAAAFLAAGAQATLNEQANSFADWLRTALLVHPDGGPLRRCAGNLELPFVDTPSRIDLTVREASPEQTQPPEPERPEPQPDPALVETLRKGFIWQYPAADLAAVPAKVSVTSLVHAAAGPVLERPAFLSKDGLTAAEMGTALHAFLEHADFAALAKARAQGSAALDEAICAERDRQVEVRLTAPEIAEKLDTGRIRRFVKSEAFDRICAADKVLREQAFITVLPAAEVLAAQGGAAEDAPDAPVLVQGIADLLLVYPDHLELLDYKTDRGRAPADLVRIYRAQLDLYAQAFDRRFAPRRVTYKGIYSFALGRLIKVD